MLKRSEISCREAAKKAIIFREKQLGRIGYVNPVKLDIIMNELKFLKYAKDNILHG